MTHCHLVLRHVSCMLSSSNINLVKSEKSYFEASFANVCVDPADCIEAFQPS
jgi:hypothetical protein